MRVMKISGVVLLVGTIVFFLSFKKEKEANWQLGPFEKVDEANPILGPNEAATFFCPVRKENIHWEAKDVFNPSAVVIDGKVALLYRAEDKVGKYAGTSRIGLALSSDGINFKREPEPVLYPAADAFKKYEWEGGCEDPRVVQDANGTYYMTYSAWEGTNSYMSIASSKDLRNWTKYGPVFRKALGGKYEHVWVKSGAIVTKRVGSKMIAQKIKGKYWMYWGDTHVFLATSTDLVNWTPVEYEAGERRDETVRAMYKDIKPVFGPRKGKFDSDLVEPGPAPMITDKGILFIYNSRNSERYGDPKLAPGTYSAGQILLDKNNPSKVISRADNYFMTPDRDFEINGQVNRVCFVEGLVYFNNKWFLYYGTADSKIAVAEYNPAENVSAPQFPEEKLGWQLGSQAYTFNRFSFFEAVEKIKTCGLKYVEGYPGQVIGGGFEGNMDYHMPEDKMKKVLSKLRAEGVAMVSFGVTVADNEGDWRQLFKFANTMGIRNLTAEPDPKFMPLLSELCDRYKINLAIHNHPEPTRYWNPDIVLNAIKGQSKRIGMCADIGHWIRSGLDPVECLKKAEGHIVQLHFKDLNKKSKDAHDVHWGQGVANVKAVMQELKRQKFKGLFSVEYEHNWENNVPDVQASVNYFRQIVPTLQ